MTAKTAVFIVECVVDKTFNDHYKKCVVLPHDDCSHVSSGNLGVARVVESAMKIGKKRATLDLACPYSMNDPKAQIILLENVAVRISQFSERGDVSTQVRVTCERITNEILDYAHRNAMEVIAEAAL